MGRWLEAARRQRKVFETAASMLTDEQALTVKNAYRQWEALAEAGATERKGYRFRCGDALYRVEQPVLTFTKQYIPGSVGTESLFSRIWEGNPGTFEAPIPYEKNMEVFQGSYYSQYGTVYLCIRSSGQPLQHDLAALVGNFVEVVE